MKLTYKNKQKTISFPESYRELLKTIGEEFNIDEYDKTKSKYCIFKDGEGSSYKIKNKNQSKGFRKIIEEQKHIETERTFNYDGDIQREEGSLMSKDIVKQVLETIL